MKSIAYIFVIFLLFNWAYSLNLYVDDVTGEDQEFCGKTIDQPCKSIGYTLENVAIAEDKLNISPGEYGGPSNVPLDVKLRGLKFEGTGSVFINCSQADGHCIKITPHGGGKESTMEFKNINIRGFKSDASTFQSQSVVIIEKDEEGFMGAAKNYVFDSVFFSDNTLINGDDPIVQNHPWAAGNIISIQEQIPHSMVTIQNCEFFDNTISVINSYTSSINIDSCNFYNNNVEAGISMIFAGYMHAFLGGSNYTMTNCQIYNNKDNSLVGLPLMGLGGVRCDDSDDRCSAYTFDSVQIYENEAKSGIDLVGGANIQISNSMFSKLNVSTNVIQNIMSTQSSGIQLLNNNFEYIFEEASQSERYLVSGRFETSEINDNSFNDTLSTGHIRLIGDGGLIIINNKFISGTSTLVISNDKNGRQSLTIQDNSFQGGGISAFIYSIGAVATVTFTGNTVTGITGPASKSNIVVGGTASFLLDGNTFESATNAGQVSVISCDGNDIGIIGFVGDENKIPSANTFAFQNSQCKLVCNTANSGVCGTQGAVPHNSHSSSSGGVSDAAFITTLVLSIISGIIITVLVLVAAGFFVKSRLSGGESTPLTG